MEPLINNPDDDDSTPQLDDSLELDSLDLKSEACTDEADEVPEQQTTAEPLQQPSTIQPTSTEFIEFNYAGFSVKLGSACVDVLQLTRTAYEFFQLIKKEEETKSKSYYG